MSPEWINKSRVYVIAYFFILFFCFTFGSPCQARLQGAAGTIVLTPADLNTTCLGGYDFGRPARGVHDDIKARAWMLKDAAGAEIGICVLDMVGYMSIRIDQIKATLAAEGLPVSNLIIESTHSHSSPDGVGIWGTGCGITGVGKDYLDWVDHQVTVLIRRLRTEYQPVSLRFGSSMAPGLITDVRAPRTPDDEVVMMQAVADSNQVLFTTMNYGVHATVLGSDNLLLSADVTYYICKGLEDHFGGTAIWSPGSEGAVYFTEGEETFANAEQQGNTLVNTYGVPALAGQPLRRDLTFTTDFRRVRFFLENSIFRLASASGWFEISYEDLERNDFRIPTDVSYWTMSDGNHIVASVVSGPGEIFPDVGLAIKSNMPGDYKFIPNISNNQLGYFIPYDEYQFPSDPFNPGDHYHETTSAGGMLVPDLLSAVYEMIGVETPTPVATVTPTPSPTNPPTPEMSSTPRPTRTPTATPTATPPAFSTILELDSVFENRTLAVNLRVANPSSTTTMPVDLWLLMELGGTFYTVPGFSEALSPLAAGLEIPTIDTGWFNLLSLPVDPLGGATATLDFYGAFVDSATGGLRGSLASDSTEVS